MPTDVYNQNWFSTNAMRRYPIHSQASCVDNTGKTLPDDIILDLNISFPKSLGDYCYVAAVTSTDKMLSVLIGSDTGYALAGLYVTRPLKRNQYYVMSPLVSSVSAAIVLGPGSNSSFGAWRFDDPTSTRIQDNCCNIYVPIGVTSLGRELDNNPLTGDILLTAAPDLKLSVKNISYDPTDYGTDLNNRYKHFRTRWFKAIFIGLDTDTNDKTEILEAYTNACSVSTESDNCSRSYTAGIGPAIPDSNGNVIIESETLTITSNKGNIAICPLPDLKLSDICETESPLEKFEKYRQSACPFDKAASDDICPEESESSSSSSEESESSSSSSSTGDITVCPLPSTTTASASSSINLYNSGITVVSGGIEYGDTRGITNDDLGGPLTITANIQSNTGVIFGFAGIESGYGEVTVGDTVITIDSGIVTFGSESFDCTGSTSVTITVNSSSIVFTTTADTKTIVHSTAMPSSVTVKLSGIYLGVLKNE